MCQMCGSLWHRSDFDMKLKPQRLRNRTKYLKLIEKFDASKPEISSGLSQKQRRRAKWLKKRLGSFVDITCKQCNHKSSIKLNKPLVRRKLKGKEEKNKKIVTTILLAEQQRQKKGKKPKDKNAGLKLPVLRKPEMLVQISRRTDLQDDQRKETITTNNTLQKSTNNVAKLTNCNLKLTHNSTKSVNKTTKPTNNRLKATNSDSRTMKQVPKNTNKLQVNAKGQQSNGRTSLNNNSNCKKSVPAAKTKTISKTQQKNSILQLAALLKKKTSNFNQGLDHNRLSLLLK